MHLPEGEVPLRDVMEWVQEQAQFLTPTQTHVLWYLCANAWRKPDNPEGQLTGGVMSGRTKISTICARTGLSRRTVREAMWDLQESAYIYCQYTRGRGTSAVNVFWTGAHDATRAEIRAGAKELPKALRRPAPEANEGNEEGEDAVVLKFPNVQPLHI